MPDTHTMPFGDPAEWDGEMPAAFVAAIEAALSELGWIEFDANETFITVELPTPLDLNPSGCGDHFSIWWHQGSESFCYGAHEDGHTMRFNNPGELGAETDPVSVARQMDRILRTGSPNGQP